MVDTKEIIRNYFDGKWETFYTRFVDDLPGTYDGNVRILSPFRTEKIPPL